MQVIKGGLAEEVSTAAGISAGTVAVAVLAAFSVTGDTPKEDGKDYLYRNMKPDSSFFSDPMLGQSANTLGIRASDVDYRGFDQIISPFDNQGLSVTFGVGTSRFDSVKPQGVPNFSNQTKLWRLSPEALIPLGLLVAPQISPPGYCRIIPAYNMTIQTFHKRIQATQSLWSIAKSNQ
jgi:hypothetical protein